MIEPTESESKKEIDRFCDAMISIRKEITNIESGNADSTNNVLKNAPHTVEEACADNWAYPYSRSDAVYPNNVKASEKYWPPVKRVDNVYGDKNIFCTCPSIDEFKEDAA